MICETCHGTGLLPTQLKWGIRDVPCQDCIGGISYCCGGSERYGQLETGEVIREDSDAASKPAGSAWSTDQDRTSPPNECHQRCWHCGAYADECQCSGGYGP
jgi:hypothetical protein